MKLKKLLFYRKTNIRFALLVCAVVLSFSASTYAQDATSPCDPEYMDALEARAWLEAQREIMQNKNFIFKPDSVLEYTCFHWFLNETATSWDPGRQFSETDRWNGHPDGFSYESLDIALTNVVLAPLSSYLSTNFNVMGNMGSMLNDRGPDPHLPKSRVQSTDYAVCEMMREVWHKARCMNFNEPDYNDWDGFFDFSYYEGTDPRQEGSGWSMECRTPDPRIASARVVAFNEDQDLFNVGSPEDTDDNAADGNDEPYEEDDVVTHLDYILPGTCEGPAIDTGIMVERPDLNSGAPYPERVCPNPGCTNTPDTIECNP